MDRTYLGPFGALRNVDRMSVLGGTPKSLGGVSDVSSFWNTQSYPRAAWPPQLQDDRPTVSSQPFYGTRSVFLFKGLLKN